MYDWEKRPSDEAERLRRLAELKERLPRSSRGYGLDKGAFVIKPQEARTRQEYTDAEEYWNLVKYPSHEYWEMRQDHPIKHHPLRRAIIFSRETFRYEGWPSPSCYTAWSKREKDWFIYDGVFKRYVRKRVSATPWPKAAPAKSLRNAFINAEIQLLPAYMHVILGSYGEEGAPIYYAARIYSRFRDVIRQRRTWSMQGQSALISVGSIFEIGELYGEAMHRFQYEREAMIGSGLIAAGKSGRQAALASDESRIRAVVCAMEEYISKGQSVSNAARMTHQIRKLGSSAQANRQLYYRNRGKL